MINEEKWYVAQAAFMTVSIREEVEKLPFKTFVPVLVSSPDKKKGTATATRQTGKLLTFNYVFIRGKRTEVEEALRYINRIHLLYSRPGVAQGKSYGNFERKPLSVGDAEMEMFIRTVSLYQNGAPITDFDTHDIEKGDYVRVIGGTFKGVEGVLETHKGKVGGKVVVSISHLVSVKTLDIEPEYIQVIRFSSENKHIYRKMDNFLPKVSQAVDMRLSGVELDENMSRELRSFINLYSVAETETQNTTVKLRTLIFLSYVALGIDDYANEIYHELKKNYLPRLKSERVKTLVCDALGKYEKIKG